MKRIASELLAVVSIVLITAGLNPLNRYQTETIVAALVLAFASYKLGK
jgi:hypothetical protein